MAAIKGIWFSSGSAERAAFIGGAAVVLAALLLSLAIIVRADVLARSQAQAAEYAAREHITAAFLHAAERAQADAAHSATKYWIKTNETGEWRAVDHFTTERGFVAVLADTAHTRIPGKRIKLVTKAAQVS